MTRRPSLRDRMVAYAANLRSIAAQLRVIVEQVEAVRQDVNPETQPLRDSIRLYETIADDIDKVLAGEPLKTFIITGELPTS
jgi:hypothetical protein